MSHYRDLTQKKVISVYTTLMADPTTKSLLASGRLNQLQWNNSFLRMTALVVKCIENKEPVLLVGETSGGKTTMVMLLSVIYRRALFTVNCNKYTETPDFIGQLKPSYVDRSAFVEVGEMLKSVEL